MWILGGAIVFLVAGFAGAAMGVIAGFVLHGAMAALAEWL